mmetsp:Transcript_46418/g.104841  ORF Transcript_46418/g.104841 Transcript_46418/m.104841 type:complete len:407 (+) Transcript_46418:750-1970(+)
MGEGRPRVGCAGALVERVKEGRHRQRAQALVPNGRLLLATQEGGGAAAGAAAGSATQGAALPGPALGGGSAPGGSKRSSGRARGVVGGAQRGRREVHRAGCRACRLGPDTRATHLGSRGRGRGRGRGLRRGLGVGGFEVPGVRAGLPRARGGHRRGPGPGPLLPSPVLKLRPKRGPGRAPRQVVHLAQVAPPRTSLRGGEGRGRPRAAMPVGRIAPSLAGGLAVQLGARVGPVAELAPHQVQLGKVTDHRADAEHLRTLRLGRLIESNDHFAEAREDLGFAEVRRAAQGLGSHPIQRGRGPVVGHGVAAPKAYSTKGPTPAGEARAAGGALGGQGQGLGDPEVAVLELPQNLPPLGGHAPLQLAGHLPELRRECELELHHVLPQVEEGGGKRGRRLHLLERLRPQG